MRTTKTGDLALGDDARAIKFGLAGKSTIGLAEIRFPAFMAHQGRCFGRPEPGQQIQEWLNKLV